MKTRTSFGTLLLAISVLSAATANSQEVSENRNNAQIIDGANEPEKIPYALKVRAFLIDYDPIIRQNLVEEFSLEDAAVIESILGVQEFNLAEEKRQYDNNFSDLCSRRDTMDAVPLAIEYMQQAEDTRNAEAERYRASLSMLSEGGKATVDQYIAKRVTPNMKMGVDRSLELAKSDPEHFKFTIDLFCYVNEHGELPPGAIDESVVKEVPETDDVLELIE